MTRYLGASEFVAIAARVLGESPKTIAVAMKADVAVSALAAPAAGFGDEDQYPDLVMKAAVLMSRIGRNHPLPDGNKRAARQSGLIFLELNGVSPSFSRSLAKDPNRNDAIMRDLVSSKISAKEFADWLRARLEA